jgi:hypothetical protein
VAGQKKQVTLYGGMQMSKMTIIQLLNKIANDEEVPKKIKFDNQIWDVIYGEKNIYYTNYCNDDLFIVIFKKNLTFTLNDTVEILDEKEIPEKLKDILKVDDLILPVDGNMYEIWEQTIKNQNKINEILDYLESEGE